MAPGDSLLSLLSSLYDFICYLLQRIVYFPVDLIYRFTVDDEVPNFVDLKHLASFISINDFMRNQHANDYRDRRVLVIHLLDKRSISYCSFKSNKVIDEIDAAINSLNKVKEDLLGSLKNLRLTNEKAQKQLTTAEKL